MSLEQLAHPEWAGPVAASWALAAAGLLAARARARGRRRRLCPGLAPGHSLMSDAALLLALFALGLALLGPRVGEKRVLAPASGVDVVLLLDVSRSMDAADVPPSRFSRARLVAEALLKRLHEGDRAALAAFASRGVLLTPLTPDHGALSELLAALDTNLVQPSGSKLGAGLRAALTAFEAGSRRPRVVFVLSDGEDPERSGDLGVRDALGAQVRVLAAAFGSEAGITLPDHGLPLRDASGAAVVSRRRSDRLERLADSTDGALFVADAWGGIDLESAAAALRRDAGGLPGELRERRVRAVQVLPFAALAFAVLALESLPWWGRRAAPALATGLAALLVGAAPPQMSPGPAEARLGAAPRDARSLIELGLERLARGSRDAARRAFLAAALTTTDPDLAELAYYDLGVAALEQGDYAAARDAFFDALALEPDDVEARYNLEWASKALSKAPPPQAGDEESGDEDARPDTAPQPEARGAERRGGEGQRAGLTPEQRQRWLGRVHDDLDHALRSAVGSGERRPRGHGPAW